LPSATATDGNVDPRRVDTLTQKWKHQLDGHIMDVVAYDAWRITALAVW
jgi:hypothetical protein